MLGKLIKYELQGTARNFLPLFVAMLVFSIINRVFGSMFGYRLEWISGLLIFVEVVLIIAVCVMVLVITIQRFYKNLLGNEGYLMFTLPVSAHHNILAKLIVGAIWNAATVVLVALSIIIMVWQSGPLGMMFRESWWGFANAVSMELGLSPILMLVEWTIVALLSLSSAILLLYLAMAIGQLFNVHKFLASFGAYILLMIGQVTALAILGNIIAALPSAWFHGLSVWVESLSTPASVQLVTLVMALSSLIVSAAYYFATFHLLHKKLNLT